jgi:glycosyltransferase involved in cell wall biosynthesis
LGDSIFNILFAGRHNENGLELLLEAIKKKSDTHLHLAGGFRLVELAQEKLENDRFTYHGLLSSDKIAKLLHQVQLVSVLSQCFDVYPTITIEALSHKIPVLTTNLTGNSNLVSKLSDSLVINYGQIPDLKQVQEILSNPKLIFPEIITVKDSWKSYKSIFSQTS